MHMISEIRNAWGWVGIDPVQIVLENSFGNLIIEDAAGQFWRLCPEDVYCKVIAKNKSDLDIILKSEDFQVDWNMASLLKLAKAKFGNLIDGRKYCLIIPGVLGGAYDVSNIKTVPLLELIEFSGYLGEQIHDLPDSQKIELKIVS